MLNIIQKISRLFIKPVVTYPFVITRVEPERFYYLSAKPFDGLWREMDSVNFTFSRSDIPEDEHKYIKIGTLFDQCRFSGRSIVTDVPLQFLFVPRYFTTIKSDKSGFYCQSDDTPPETVFLKRCHIPWHLRQTIRKGAIFYFNSKKPVPGKTGILLEREPRPTNFEMEAFK